MLLRPCKEGFIAISQPFHAWLAGELTRAWGGRFERPKPFETIVCAAALHDIGWLDWEAEPQFDVARGTPLEFQNVPAEVHTGLWGAGVSRAAVYGDHVALLVSRHGDAIYERTFDEASARPAATKAVRAFRNEQKHLQSGMIERLSTDAETAAYVTDDQLDFVKRFIVAVDTISLNLCWGVSERVTIADVPSLARPATDLTLSATKDVIHVDPWPFATDELNLCVEGKHIPTRFKDEREMRDVLRGAPPARISIRLRPQS